MDWTTQQREAIELQGKNILVAAAAGSGKTAVLVERIKRLILDEKCSVDRMLIVTFTNAAAAEMKEKIYKSLSDSVKEASLNEENRQQLIFLKRQMDLLSTANISTFHAFALEVIRRYFYLINIEPNFKICDSIQEALLKSEAMDQLLEELFEEASPEFFDFLKCYSGDRDESRFRNIVANCYSTILSLPEPFFWLSESVSQLKDGFSLKEGPAGKQLFKTAQDKIRRAEEFIQVNHSIASDMGLSDLQTLCSKDMQQIDILRKAGDYEDYEAFRKAIGDFKLPVMSSKIFAGADEPEEIKTRVSDNRNSAKKQIKDLKEIYFAGSFEELCHEMSGTYQSGLYLEEILIRYDQIYKMKKAEKNVVDFSDIEHYAYDILKDKEASDFYRERFEHIFIDEYQDSNVIQEELIGLIKRQNNLFMVGDVKQSIYKFRLAEPEIFQSKYKSYEEGLVPDSVKIDLNKNFRSKKPVIDFINGLFFKVMEDYDENAALYPGDVYSDKAYSNPKMYLAQVPWDENSEVDEELKSIMKAEKEALAAAKIIKDNLGEKIFDSKQGRERPLEKRDIVILMRGVKNYGDVFYKVLSDNNIQSYIDDNDGFFNTIEINSFLSALYIIDNPKQDVQLLTLMRSQMLGFSIEEMVKIRIQFKTGSYYDAFKNYSLDGDDKLLRIKCQKAFESIENWRELSLMMPLDKLIWKMLLDTGFYISMGAMPAGGQRQANLRALTDKALAYQNMGGGTLYGFIKYVEAIKENKVSMGQVKLLGEKDDLVRIMTVHKSKGLEFPMVILAGYCRKLTYSSAGKAPVMHKDLGIGFPIVEPSKHWYKTTLLQNMIKERFHREEVDEEKRILYVALTRAKDRLAILGICNDVQRETNDLIKGSPKDNNYFTMTGKVICSDLKAFEYMKDEQIIGLSKGNRRSIDRILKVIDEGCDFVSEQVEDLMDFVYPYSEDLTLKSKYAVSELNNKGRKLPETLNDPVFAAGTKRISAVDRGTIYHSVLEHMNVSEAQKGGKEYIKQLVNQMVDCEILLPEEGELIEPGKLMTFVNSDLADRISKSPAVYREKPFNLLMEHEGKRIVVQGIIDCYFEEDDYLVLVDYKTGKGKEARHRYSLQINLYKRALETATDKKVNEAYLYMTDSAEIIKM